MFRHKTEGSFFFLAHSPDTEKSKQNQQMMMADYCYVKDEEGESALCIKETPPTPRSPASRFRRWLFPALTAVILLILIILLGATCIKMSNHLQSLEQRLSNQSDIQSLQTSVQKAQDMSNQLLSVEQKISILSDIIKSIDTSPQHAQDMSNHLLSVEQSVSNLSDIIRSLDPSLQHTQETAKEVKQLLFAVESNKNQLTSVSEVLKQLKSAVESNKNQLTSVSEVLKQLEVIDSLSRSITAIKCSLKSSSTEGCCPPDWTAFESSCYYFSRGSLSWNDSRDRCETRQAHLVILRADKEWDFVTNRTIPEYFWIGLSDWRTGSWEWVDQTPYTVESRRWRPGQPDNWAGHGLGPGTEDCAHLHDDGSLNDQHCSIKLHFICQKHSMNI
ncbi:asialoglycoprotein receptor 1-like isoform X2 [Archocentrus centrarchus]|uniref:asialoglycoprotein receptor 1-like isoform X2 n=1 Tax=Archocentrus centrarchus TaxID=63155 RepID=UPI0011E9FAD3|nr:asialoglycoprotein receptor 1-like isoform X2 [Archocentrus centrarchus]